MHLQGCFLVLFFVICLIGLIVRHAGFVGGGFLVEGFNLMEMGDGDVLVEMDEGGGGLVEVDEGGVGLM